MFLTHAGRGIRAILDQKGRWERAYDSEELSLYYANAFMYLCRNGLAGMRDERAGNSAATASAC